MSSICQHVIVMDVQPCLMTPAALHFLSVCPRAAQRKACGRNLLESRWAQWLGARNLGHQSGTP